jgi:uncharacterized protein YutE (UPF0331/DUF86 family)
LEGLRLVYQKLEEKVVQEKVKERLSYLVQVVKMMRAYLAAKLGLELYPNPELD